MYIYLRFCASNGLFEYLDINVILMAGEYNVSASNSAGRKSCDVKVAVVGKPGLIDGRLDISELTAEFAVLNWSPPKNDGGLNQIYSNFRRNVMVLYLVP